MKKVINARMAVKPEAIKQFVSLAQIIVEASNLEKGCLVYKLYQEIGNPSSFIFFEVYENQDAVDFHNATPHFKTFIGQLTGLMAENPVIEVF